MTHRFAIPDEQFARLEQVAEQQGSTASALFQSWVQRVLDDADVASLEAARARWAALGPAVEHPSDEELRTSPLLRSMGIYASGAPGWADQHDEIIASEALNRHADE